MKYKTHFPFFTHHSTCYLDTGASSLTPEPVINAMNEYYAQCSVNIHRGLYKESDDATVKVESIRSKVAKFIGASDKEIIFTQGTTLGLNMLAQMLGGEVKGKTNIVISIAEHHANMLPWRKLAEEHGLEIRYIPLTSEFELDYSVAEELIDEGTAIVAVTGMSNVLGTITDVERICKFAKKAGAISVIDAAQLVAHRRIDVAALGCDFLAFGAHKMYGPFGVGILYGKEKRLEHLSPAFVGGDIVSYVTNDSITLVEPPYVFETGTPPIAEIIGLGAAIDFLEACGLENIEKHEQQLTTYGLTELQKIPGLTIIGPSSAQNRGGALSFIIEGIHIHDIADLLAKREIAVRAGSHCAMPLALSLGLNGTVRASLGIYSTKDDIDTLTAALKEIITLFT